MTDVLRGAAARRGPSSRRGFRLGATGLVVMAAVALGACEDKPQMTPAEHIERAQQHLANGRTKAGIIDLKNALQQNPDHAQARVLIGKAYLEAGDAVAAIDELERAKDLKAGPEILLLPLGRAMLARGRFEDILAEFPTGADVARPVRWSSLVMRGLAQLGLGNTEKANETFRAALAIDPNAPLAYVGLARTAIAQDDDQKAQAAVATAESLAPLDPDVLSVAADLATRLGDRDKAEGAYQALADLRPENPFPRLPLANAQIAAGRYDDAIANLDIALSLFPKYPPALYLRALAALRQGDYQTAETHANLVLAEDRDHLASQLVAGLASYNLGHTEQATRLLGLYLRETQNDDVRKLYATALTQLQRISEAYDALRPLMKGNLDDVQTVAMLSDLAVRAGDIESGQTLLAKLTELRPDDTATQVRLGLLELERGDPELAVKRLEKALEADPEQGRAVAGLYTAYMRNRQFDLAIGISKKMQKARPDDPVGWMMAGTVGLAMNNVGAAQEAFEQALEVRPGDPHASLSLANVLIVRGELEAAREVLTASVGSYPETLNTTVRLAAVEDGLGNRDAARQWLERAREINPKAVAPGIALAKMYRMTGDPAAALDVATPLLTENRSNPELLAVVARSQLLLRRFDDAAGTLRRLTEVVPDSPEAHFLLATTYLNLRDWGRLRRAVETVVSLQPDRLESKFFLARLVGEQGDVEAARRLLGELRERAPDDPRTTEIQALVAALDGEYATAIDLYRQAETGQPGPNRDLTLRLAATQWTAGRLEDSARTLTSWLDNAAQDHEARTILGGQFMEMGRWADARAAFETVLAALPNAWPIRNNLAVVLVELGEANAAAEQIQQAVRASNRNANVLDTAAIVMIAAGRPGDAVGFAREATSARPGNLSFRFRLVQALVADGSAEEARGLLARLLAEDGEFAEREEAKALMEGIGG